MKGDAQPLIKFFDGADKRFIIPLYQRNYDWKEENCEQLFQDLKKLHQSDRKSHFFGSIVSRIQPGTEDRLIIDGQQRITTVSLLLIAMINAEKEGLIKSADAKLAKKIHNYYLVDEYQEDERKIKLKPIKKDRKAFDALFDNSKEQHIKESNVTRNYDFLYDKITRSGLTLDELFDAIKRLEVINIRLDEDDDPQLIFESLNSTGLDLSEADKIRNYLLMSLSPAEQDELYTRFWNPIEEFTKYNPSLFVRDYLTMKRGEIGRIDKTYHIFKDYTEKRNIDRASLLEEMHHYAKIYSQIDNARIETKRLNEKLNGKLNQLRTLDSTIAYPFFMAFFDYAYSVDLEETEIYRVLDVIETYWARRIICNLPSNALNKLFATLHREVKNLIDKASDGSKPSYIDVLIYVLLKKKHSYAFPPDEEVKRDFKTRQVYKMPTNTRMFILERLENQDDNKESHEVVKKLLEKKISIEHIMPQTLSNKWKMELGDDWERIHEQYLHTMANLTLTGYNSQYSNLPFIEKREMEKGFKDSAFRLNIYLRSCNQWTEEELKTRQNALLNVFMRLWPMPTTTFEPLKREAESASLDDEDFEFTGKKLQAFTFRGIRHTVNTWKEMLIQVCGYILIDKRSTIEWLCANEKPGFSTSPEEWRHELAPKLYVWTDNSTATKINILQGLFKECNIPASELIFEFRSNADGEQEEL